MNLNPLSLLSNVTPWLYAIVAAVSLSTGLYFGYHYAKGSCAEELANLRSIQQSFVDKDKKEFETKVDPIVKDFDNKDQKREVVVKYINRDVIHYVETHPSNPECTLDADGLRLANAAITGQYPVAGVQEGNPGQSKDQVPGNPSSGNGNTAGSSGETR